MKLFRDIPPGQSLPMAAVVTRTGRSPDFNSKQLIVRFPLWASYRTRYQIHDDAFITGWWVRIVQLTLERAASLPIIAFRMSWGDVPISQREKPYEQEALGG